MVAIGVAGAPLIGAALYWSAGDLGNLVPDLRRPAVAADAGPLSIVVLPFANYTGDDSQSYVADGLTASLTAGLGRVRSLFVVNARSRRWSRTMSRRWSTCRKRW